MAEYHFPVPGQEVEGEKIIICTHRHWAAFLGAIFLTFILIILPVVGLLILGFTSDIFQTGWRNIIILGGSVYYLIIFNFAFIEWITYYYDIYIVTERRIIDIVQTGIFNRSITELPLLRIQNSTSEIKGFLPTLFAYGNVVTETAGEAAESFVFRDVPNPVEVASKIMALQEKILAQEKREEEIGEAEGRLREPPVPPETKDEEGKIDKNQLDQGGQVKL